jgi:predicted ATP-dependent serine protease
LAVAAATLAGVLDVAEEVAAAVAVLGEVVAVVAAVVAASPAADCPSKRSMVCLGRAGLHGHLRWQASLVYRLRPAFRLLLSWQWIDCPR